LSKRHAALVETMPVRNSLFRFWAVQYEWSLLCVHEHERGRSALGVPCIAAYLSNRIRVDVVVVGESDRDHGLVSSSAFSRRKLSIPAHHHFASAAPSRSVHPKHGFHALPPPAADAVYPGHQNFFTFPATKYWVYL
jgi:hypothetical protein